ncbi:MAG: 16S rRNA (uracil(1498)-N(3))-methyltransferase [Pseudomonadota bacterium]
MENLKAVIILEAEKYKKLVRLYIPDADFAHGEKCRISEGQAHYLRSVMRKTPGDALRVFNGRDGDWLATISELNKKNALLEMDHKLLEQERSPDIWVLASPVKKEAFDLMIEKSCELGAARFTPVVCEHTVVHKINQERLQAIAIEAAEQSERFDVMSVDPLMDLKKCLVSTCCDRNIIFCIERARAASLSETARELAGRPLVLLIGPEGGFSSREIEFIRGLKYVNAVTLGPRILKSETALIAALSGVQLLIPPWNPVSGED